ncbi:hypothetical protein D3C80_1631730 [compost metagenome]
MLKYSFGHCLRFSSLTGIILTHYTLQLWEFVYHLCNQIKFTNFRSAINSFSRSGIHFQQRGQLFGIATNAANLIPYCSQLFVEHDAFKFGQSIFDHHFLIFFIEEFRIRKTSAKYFFITSSNNIK